MSSFEFSLDMIGARLLTEDKVDPLDRARLARDCARLGEALALTGEDGEGDVLMVETTEGKDRRKREVRNSGRSETCVQASVSAAKRAGQR